MEFLYINAIYSHRIYEKGQKNVNHKQCISISHYRADIMNAKIKIFYETEHSTLVNSW